MEDYEYYHTDEFDPYTEYNSDVKHTQELEEAREYDSINFYGRYALTPDEMYDRVGDVLALSYGEAAARRICRAWSRRAEGMGRERQLLLRH